MVLGNAAISDAKAASSPPLSLGMIRQEDYPTSQLSLTDPGRHLGAPAGESGVREA